MRTGCEVRLRKNTQGGPLSPVYSEHRTQRLDQELERRGTVHQIVADDPATSMTSAVGEPVNE